MADDIVTRLREEVAKAEVADVLPNWELARCMWEAADEIERLRTEIRRLQGTLGDVLGERDHWKWSATGNE